MARTITTPSKALSLAARRIQKRSGDRNMDLYLCVELLYMVSEDIISEYCAERCTKYIETLLENHSSLGLWLATNGHRTSSTKKVNATRVRWARWMARQWKAKGC
jgi:hypothetical protein